MYQRREEDILRKGKKGRVRRERLEGKGKFFEGKKMGNGRHEN